MPLVTTAYPAMFDANLRPARADLADTVTRLATVVGGR